MYIGVGLLLVMLYRGNRSNSRAEWNEALEGDLTKYILNQIRSNRFRVELAAFIPVSSASFPI